MGYFDSLLRFGLGLGALRCSCGESRVGGMPVTLLNVEVSYPIASMGSGRREELAGLRGADGRSR